MKKRYSRKQIQEAINYWQNKLNESNDADFRKQIDSLEMCWLALDSVKAFLMKNYQTTLKDEAVRISHVASSIEDEIAKNEQ